MTKNSSFKRRISNQTAVKRLILLANNSSEKLPLATATSTINKLTLDQSHKEMSWLAGIAKGNIEDFKLLFGFYAPRLKGYLGHLGFLNSQAEELVQEVMISIWQSASQYKPELAIPSTWIYRIARNRAIDELRRLKRHERLLTSEQHYHEIGKETAFNPSDNIESPGTQDHHKILLFLAELSPNQRQIMEMFFFASKSHRIISKELGLPLGTVKSRLRLALDHLRKILIDEEKFL